MTLATGTATLITLARRLGMHAEQLMAATSIATARLQALRAIPWEYGLDGSASDVAMLALTPVDALEPHEARDGIDRVMTPDVLDEHQDLARGRGERACRQ